MACILIKKRAFGRVFFQFKIHNSQFTMGAALPAGADDKRLWCVEVDFCSDVLRRHWSAAVSAAGALRIANVFNEGTSGRNLPGARTSRPLGRRFYENAE
jgi:hypothetical protein